MSAGEISLSGVHSRNVPSDAVASRNRCPCASSTATDVGKRLCSRACGTK